MDDLQAVTQHVLPVARAVTQAAEHRDDRLGDVRDSSPPAPPPCRSSISSSSISLLVLATISSIRAGWMRPSWTSFSRLIRATSRRTRSKETTNDAGRVVDDHVDAGRLLEAADVAPFAADDAALHVVRRQLDDRDGSSRQRGRPPPAAARRRRGSAPAASLRPAPPPPPAAPSGRARAGQRPPSARGAAASPSSTVIPEMRWSSSSTACFVGFNSSWSCF